MNDLLGFGETYFLPKLLTFIQLQKASNPVQYSEFRLQAHSLRTMTTIAEPPFCGLKDVSLFDLSRHDRPVAALKVLIADTDSDDGATDSEGYHPSSHSYTRNKRERACMQEEGEPTREGSCITPLTVAGPGDNKKPKLSHIGEHQWTTEEMLDLFANKSLAGSKIHDDDDSSCSELSIVSSLPSDAIGDLYDDQGSRLVESLILSEDVQGEVFVPKAPRLYSAPPDNALVKLTGERPPSPAEDTTEGATTLPDGHTGEADASDVYEAELQDLLDLMLQHTPEDFLRHLSPLVLWLNSFDGDF